MSTSQTTTLSEPHGADKIPSWTLSYFRARLKQRVHSLLIREFKKSGLSQADLGRRLDKEPAQLSRLLSGPGNLTLDSVSDFLFAIGGGELGLSVEHPLAARATSANQPKVQVPSTAMRSGFQQIQTEAKPGLIDALKSQTYPTQIAA
jgi:transcriptional regulator with XRE-family HTH domain